MASKELHFNVDARAALKRGVDLFDPKVPVGLIAVTAAEGGAHSNQDMPQARIVAP